MTGRIRSVGVRLLALLVSLGPCIPVGIAGWTWPVESIETLAPGMDRVRPPVRENRGPTASSARFLRFRFSGTEPIAVFAPMSGRIIIHGAVPDIAGGETSVVFRDVNEFWAILDTRRFEWLGRDGSVPVDVTSGELIGSALEVAISVYDRLNDRYVNPRAFFPYRDRLPEDRIPPLRALQEGAYYEFPRRGSVELEPGAVQIVSPAGVVDPSRFPQALYVLRDGLIQRQFSFLFEEEVAAHFNDRGDLVLLEEEIAVGRTEFEIEARRFDGTTVRRTIRLEALRKTPRTPQPSPVDSP